MKSSRFPRPRFSLLLGLVPLQLVEAKLTPALARGLDILLLGPDCRRKARAAKFRVGVVIEVHGGVDQHPIPFAGTEQSRVAVALARRWVDSEAERRRHDDDVVLTGIDAIGNRPIDR